MKNSLFTLFIVSASLFLSGCIYTDIRVPMSSEFRNTRTVTKSGEATTRSIAWLVAWGDAGLQKAAGQGPETFARGVRALYEQHLLLALHHRVHRDEDRRVGRACPGCAVVTQHAPFFLQVGVLWGV